MLILLLDYNVPTRYHALSSSEFQQLLVSRDGMSEEIALDFTEQLLIFEKCGNVYAQDEFVQAREVSQRFSSPLNMEHLLGIAADLY